MASGAPSRVGVIHSLRTLSAAELRFIRLGMASARELARTFVRLCSWCIASDAITRSIVKSTSVRRSNRKKTFDVRVRILILKGCSALAKGPRKNECIDCRRSADRRRASRGPLTHRNS